MAMDTAMPPAAVLADHAAVTFGADYELLDCGDGRRLERFGDRVADRPAPAATDRRRVGGEQWRAADLRFEPDEGWRGDDRGPWQIQLGPATLELRPGPGGQIGVYPEHASFWPWLRELIVDRSSPSVLNLFGSTGATTLALAAAGARVTHVDASRGTVAWARRNAQLSALDDRPIRWIVDDALGYARRESRRGNRYDGIVLDPPSYGHAPGGGRWSIERDLDELLDAIVDIASDDVFILVTAHTTGLRPDDLAAALRGVFGSVPLVVADGVDIVATSGAVLPLGVSARMIRG